MTGIRGVLLDVDGTLLDGDAAVAGAVQSLERLGDAGLAYRLVTNTTRRSRDEQAAVMRAAGFDVPREWILMPAVLACTRILRSGRTRARLLLPPAAQRDFPGVDAVVEAGEPVDWVVVGDLGRGFAWDVLNEAFRALMGGARLLALQKNRYWHAGERGLLLDAGAFVAGLEYAAGVEAELIGKPARAFFELALAELGLDAAQVVMVGDDVVNDARGGSEAGCRSAVVRTGKFRETDLERFRPDLILDSVAALPSRLA